MPVTVWTMILFAAAFALLALAFAGYRYTANLELPKAYAHLHHEGFPTTLAAFDASYAHIPNSENGFATLMSAPALQPDDTESYLEDDEPDPDFDNMTDKESDAWMANSDEKMAETERKMQDMLQQIDAKEALEKKYGGFENIPDDELIEVLGDSDPEDPSCVEREIELNTKPLPAELQEELRAYLDERRDALTLALQASKQPNWRSPVDFKQWPESCNADHQVAARDACRWLSRRAILAASDGEPAAATEDLLAAIRIANAVATEPTVMAQLVFIACTNITIKAIEQAVNRCAFSEEHLAKLDAALAQCIHSHPIVNAYAGECALTRDGFRAEKQDVHLFQSPNHIWNVAPFRHVYNGLGLGIFGNLHFLITIRTLMECCRTPCADTYRTINRIGDATPKLYDLSIINIALGAGAFFCMVANVGVCRTAIQLLRYRIAREEFPASVHDLIPHCCQSIPIDPRDDNEVHYSRKKMGFTVETDDAHDQRSVGHIAFNVLG